MIEEEFRCRLLELAERLGCPSTSLDLWELVFTHSSYQQEVYSDEFSSDTLVTLLDRIGAEAIRLAILEYCLDKRGLDSSDGSRYEQRRQDILKVILKDFELESLYRLGKGQAKVGLTDHIRLGMVLRFIGLITHLLSYNHARRIVWDRIEQALFTSSDAWLDDPDPKSRLQEYCHTIFPRGMPVYTLTGESGAEHQKLFHCRVTLPDKRTAEGLGPSLKAAQKTAARVILRGVRPSIARSGGVPLQPAETCQFLNVDGSHIDELAARLAPTVAAKLGYGDINLRLLAVALTSPSRRSQGGVTNLRHKLLGDALETLSYALFAFRRVPLRSFGSSNISNYMVAVCSTSRHARLFDYLSLAPLVSTSVDKHISDQAKADMLKAVLASIYLSTRDFERMYSFLEEKLGDWCQETMSMLSDNPLAVKEPKTLLQELVGHQKAYVAEYSSNAKGPEHVREVFTKVVLRDKSGKAVQIGTGYGRSIRESQQDAAAEGLEHLIPRNVAGRRSSVASKFWGEYLDPLLEGEPGTIVAACGVEHFKNMNSFTGFFGLKAFWQRLPELAEYLSRPTFLELLVHSIGRLHTTSLRRVLALTDEGILLVTGHSPDSLDTFTSNQLDDWLSELSKASVALKLPDRPLRYPQADLSLSELHQVREWTLNVAEGRASIPESMFFHILTFLECMGREMEKGQDRAEIAATANEDWRSVTIFLERGQWSRVQVERVLEALRPHAFFSGISDAVRETGSRLMVESKGVYLESKMPYVDAYSALLEHFLKAQSYVSNLHRIVHDLKNQIIAVRNYANRAKIEPKSRYQMLAAIEELQESIRHRAMGLRVFFKAADQSTFADIHLKRTVMDFMARLVQRLPDDIQLAFTDRVEGGRVHASGELLTSLLDNLTANAVDAMPDGGVLTINAHYNQHDSIFELLVQDTGLGISKDMLPELFTSMKSSKSRGMGLGLATVKQIVEQHGGLLDVTSEPGKGAQFSIVMPLDRGGENNQ